MRPINIEVGRYDETNPLNPFICQNVILVEKMCIYFLLSVDELKSSWGYDQKHRGCNT